MTIQQAFAIALQNHQSGRLAEAETLYRQILSVEPGHADALHYLGVIASQAGNYDAAANLIRQAISLKPMYPEAQSNLGNALRGMGQLDAAVAAYREAISQQPHHPEACCNLGNALWEKGQWDESLANYRQAIELRPGYPEAWSCLGKAQWKMGRLDEAIAAYRQSITLRPADPEAFRDLGNVLWEKGCLDESIAATRQAIVLRPDYAEAYNNLGIAMKAKGELDQAIAAYRQAIALNPSLPDAYSNLGNVQYDIGMLDEAIASYRQALALRPDDAEANSNMGNVLSDAGRLDEAIAAHRRAIAINPDFYEAHVNLGTAHYEHGQLDEALDAYALALKLKPSLADAHSNLGNVFACQGRPDEAIASYRRALDLEPLSVKFHTNVLMSLHYSPGTTPGQLLAEHSEFDRRHCVPLRGSGHGHRNAPSPERRIKLGYVSPDFRHNVVGHFLLPLLEAHDHRQFEIVCYAGVRSPDAITDRFKRAADGWRDVLGLGDVALAERIREDGIDILVDLSQHMPGNRLLAFARKPAPVQVAWLGHPWSTGLQAMDYRLTDSRLEPEGAAWAESVETPIRLPDSWFCYDPIDACPEPGELPALRTGHVTFGCLTNFSRVNETVLQRWADVLHRVESSRFLLKCPAGRTRARVCDFFEARGIAADRIEFVGWVATRSAFHRLFDRFDIALDPFPYNGGTTTCDTLWRGVPVLTLPGAMVVSRLGLSILSASGLGELVANTEAEYMNLIMTLSKDLPRLAKLRSTLRQRMKDSALMDAPRFARNVEQAYRQMWRTWCARAG